jgi:hypothetical protein
MGLVSGSQGPRFLRSIRKVFGDYPYSQVDSGQSPQHELAGSQSRVIVVVAELQENAAPLNRECGISCLWLPV